MALAYLEPLISGSKILSVTSCNLILFDSSSKRFVMKWTSTEILTTQVVVMYLGLEKPQVKSTRNGLAMIWTRNYCCRT